MTAPVPDTRVRLLVRGLVQGVGFRPFVFRLASFLGLRGMVRNSTTGAWLEAEGPRNILETFVSRLQTEAPPPCRIDHVETTWLAPLGHPAFTIEKSETSGAPTALILPDLATCPECRQEIFDPANRRFRYPFTNCTRCGPRFSIIHGLPYDRVRTSMAGFTLCAACQAEYEDPRDRRFHAEPIACPQCGPHLALWTPEGAEAARGETALGAALKALLAGRIVALKGLGGFQLLVRADDDEAVRRLRRRKGREAKPLAVMCPTLGMVHRWCHLSPAEEHLLTGPAAPIVLAPRRARPADGPADAVAPDSPWLGVMLPYTPLHHLLLADFGLPVVATSGNRSDDPICLEELEALQRLGDIADVFLVHNRPILRPVDDSVARVVLGTEQILRRARGYAPLPASLPRGMPPAPALLALGAHLKSTIAVGRDREIVLSQHLGDLETAAAAEAFDRATRDLPRLLEITPQVVVTDLHPDYLSTQRAATFAAPILRVAHHEAHAYACLADNDLRPPVLALSWDGTGLGPDGHLWGGEFLELTGGDCLRRAAFRPFRLPGGDRAARDTRRSALGLLVESGLHQSASGRAYLARVFPPTELGVLQRVLARGILAPITSSVGRLFDAVASLLNLAHASRFEGDAAQRLEAAAWQAAGGETAGPTTDDPTLSLPLRQTPAGGWVVDWQPFLEGILAASAPLSLPAWALAWHEALAAAAVAVARRVNHPQVLLTGGCFQNRLLTERVVAALREAGFAPYWHQRIPPNDGGVALGQAVAAAFAARPRPGNVTGDEPGHEPGGSGEPVPGTSSEGDGLQAASPHAAGHRVV